MPIKGLTDNVRASLPVIGIIRKGDKKPENSNKPGRELPYFRFDERVPGVGAVFAEVHGDKPQVIEPVYFPYATPDENFPTWQEKWEKGGLQHRCDGETCVLRLMPDGTYSSDPAPCPGGCVPIGRLMMIDRALAERGFVGLVTLVTSSVNDISSIMSTLVDVHSRIGDLRNVPFSLRKYERSISTIGPDGKRISRKHFLVYLIPAPELVQVAGALPAPASASTPQALSGAVEVVEGEMVNVDTVPNGFENFAFYVEELRGMAGERKEQRSPTPDEWERFLRKMGEYQLTPERVRRLFQRVFEGRRITLGMMIALADWVKMGHVEDALAMSEE